VVTVTHGRRVRPKRKGPRRCGGLSLLGRSCERLADPYILNFALT
jgi:hypothetical protein